MQPIELMKIKFIKTILSFSIIGLLPLSADSTLKERAAKDKEISTVYNQGLAIKSTDPDKAILYFKKVLQLAPQHSNAQYQISNIRLNRDKILKLKKSKKMSARFKQMKFEVIDFSGEPLSDALDNMYAYMDRDYGEDHGVNFIIKDPQSKIRNKPVTLRLKNIPADVALNYIVQQAGAKFKYGQYAIEISPVN